MNENINDFPYPDSKKVINWLLNDGMKLSSIPEFHNEFIHILNEYGLSIIRSVVVVSTLHPQVEMIRFAWEPKEIQTPAIESNFLFGRSTYEFENSSVSETTMSFNPNFKPPKYLVSPYKLLDEGVPFIRCKISPEQKEFEFPVLEVLKNIGANDYYVTSLNSQYYNNDFKNSISWATNKKEGFTEKDIDFFDEIESVFGLCLEMYTNRSITQSLLKIYLGEYTGQKVFQGKIKRGEIEKIDAVIWFSDLRNFTSMSERTDSQTLVEWLNNYFEEISLVLANHHGEILKFIGDAVLAIFPIPEESETESICRKALNATIEANNSLKNINEKRKTKNLPELDHGIALHKGEVQYGNIGGLRRLDFTVIGKAVSLTSRIEGLCSTLKKKTLLSKDFVSYFPDDEFIYINSFNLKGINKSQEIYTLRNDLLS